MVKNCVKCMKRKDNSEFHKMKTGLYGTRNICKLCRAADRSIAVEMVANSRRRAKLKGWPHNLDVEFINELNKSQGGRCAITGIKLNWAVGSEPGRQRVCPRDRASIDRIDNSKGYTRDNVQLVTDLANRIRTYLSLEELREFCRQVSQAG